MSRPKHWWYYNAVRAIRAYPELCSRKEDARRQSITAGAEPGRRGSGAGRPTEKAAMRGLAPREEADMEAVRRALEDLESDPREDDIVRVVRLYHWKGVRNFETVGDLAHLSPRTARRYNSRFVAAVARHMGYK